MYIQPYHNGMFHFHDAYKPQDTPVDAATPVYDPPRPRQPKKTPLYSATKALKPQK